jgi:hypothetical protein
MKCKVDICGLTYECYFSAIAAEAPTFYSPGDREYLLIEEIYNPRTGKFHTAYCWPEKLLESLEKQCSKAMDWDVSPYYEEN